ncbi:hypothetical protein ES703_93070 [subsurface metagenome]
MSWMSLNGPKINIMALFPMEVCSALGGNELSPVASMFDMVADGVPGRYASAPIRRFDAPASGSPGAPSPTPGASYVQYMPYCSGSFVSGSVVDTRLVVDTK